MRDGCTRSRSGGTDFGSPSSHKSLLFHCSIVLCIGTVHNMGIPRVVSALGTKMFDGRGQI